MAERKSNELYNFNQALENLNLSVNAPGFISIGRVKRIVGLTIEAVGISAPIGGQCVIQARGSDNGLHAEVIGFDGDLVFLMPLDGIERISPGCRVTLRSEMARGCFSFALKGRVIDGLGRPIDGRPELDYDEQASFELGESNALARQNISEILDTGIKAIDSCFTFGKGQRMGLIAGSGVGKSVLLAMLAQNTPADVAVIALIGERGREVKEFVTETLGEEGLRKSVVIAEPVNASPVRRIKAAKLAHKIAEQYREQGKHVLLLMDSLTRVAHAQREIGLAIGEPPTTKGYPPSVFSLLPSLIERVGMGSASEGSISGFYTVLAENDDRSDPIVDISRASLDGQIMLSRKLADASHYPAIDLEGSISRVADKIVSEPHTLRARKLRRLWSLYRQNEDIIQIGAYEPGSNAELDLAIKLKPDIDKFLIQGEGDTFTLQQTMQELSFIESEKA
ncbi:MAG: flagellum-specific ATP synthase FliI [Rhodospirillaceae bacterium]|nr:flagellum-specific ATP synthase FliI [Rhodospirillaceae bacterium]